MPRQYDSRSSAFRGQHHFLHPRELKEIMKIGCTSELSVVVATRNERHNMVPLIELLDSASGDHGELSGRRVGINTLATRVSRIIRRSPNQ